MVFLRDNIMVQVAKTDTYLTIIEFRFVNKKKLLYAAGVFVNKQIKVENVNGKYLDFNQDIKYK